jgi:uncharacterized glyoxalase superfamily protein PhnB
VVAALKECGRSPRAKTASDAISGSSQHSRTAIIEFMVDDVDAEFARLKDKVEVVDEPKIMPWGNCTAQFRDPEGTLVSLFTPVTDTAKARFASR